MIFLTDQLTMKALPPLPKYNGLLVINSLHNTALHLEKMVPVRVMGIILCGLSRLAI